MQFIRYANLFNRVTRIRTNHCFQYNNTIVFVVPRKFVLKAIGPHNSNLEKLSRIIQKKIKIVATPHGKEDIENFVSIIIKPARFKSVEIKDNEATITAGAQSKAAIIGKNRCRLDEMRKILNQYFEVRKVRVK